MSPASSSAAAQPCSASSLVAIFDDAKARTSAPVQERDLSCFLRHDITILLDAGMHPCVRLLAIGSGRLDRQWSNRRRTARIQQNSYDGLDAIPIWGQPWGGVRKRRHDSSANIGELF